MNGKCSDCVSEGVVLDFPMVVDCEFGLLVKAMYYRMCVVVVLWGWTV